MAPKKVDDDPNDPGRKQHAGLGRARRKLRKDSFDLLSHDERFARLKAANLFRVLRGDTGDGAGAVNAESGKSFEIGLDSRAAPAVGAGDGQSDRHLLSFGHGVYSKANPVRCEPGILLGRVS